jgi:hypothetical protein
MMCGYSGSHPLHAFSELWDRNMAAMDRLYQAGIDFKSTWPTATQGVQHVWDIVRPRNLRLNCRSP